MGWHMATKLMKRTGDRAERHIAYRRSTTSPSHRRITTSLWHSHPSTKGAYFNKKAYIDRHQRRVHPHGFLQHPPIRYPTGVLMAAGCQTEKG